MKTVERVTLSIGYLTYAGIILLGAWESDEPFLTAFLAFVAGILIAVSVLLAGVRT